MNMKRASPEGARDGKHKEKMGTRKEEDRPVNKRGVAEAEVGQGHSDVVAHWGQRGVGHLLPAQKNRQSEHRGSSVLGANG